MPVNIDVGDYVMVLVSAKRNHKLQSKMRGLMRVVKAKNDLVFVVGDLSNVRTSLSHPQRIVSYPVPDRASQAL